MEKKYLIKTKAKQTEEDVSDTIEIVVRGDYTYEDGKQAISYIECEGEFAGSMTNIVVYDESLVETTRTGEFSVQLVAEKQKRHNCCYETPYGNMMLGVFCRNIKNELGKDGGVLKFSYTMDVNSEFLSENEVEISVMEALN